MKKMIIGFAVAIITAALSSCSNNDEPITGPGLTKQITSTRVEMTPITAPRYGCAGQILKHPKLLGMEPQLYTASETIKISDEEIQDIGYTYTGGRDSINNCNWMYDPNFLLWAAGIVGLILLAFMLADRYRSKTPDNPNPSTPVQRVVGTGDVNSIIANLQKTGAGGSVTHKSSNGETWEIHIPQQPAEPLQKRAPEQEKEEMHSTLSSQGKGKGKGNNPT